MLVVVCADHVDIMHQRHMYIWSNCWLCLTFLSNCRLCASIVMIDAFLGITINIINKFTVGFIPIFEYDGCFINWFVCHIKCLQLVCSCWWCMIWMSAMSIVHWPIIFIEVHYIDYDATSFISFHSFQWFVIVVAFFGYCELIPHVYLIQFWLCLILLTVNIVSCIVIRNIFIGATVSVINNFIGGLIWIFFIHSFGLVWFNVLIVNVFYVAIRTVHN